MTPLRRPSLSFVWFAALIVVLASTIVSVATAPPSAAAVMPTPSSTGVPAGTTLTPMAPSSIQHGGSYSGVRVTGGFELGPGAAVHFSDCVIDGSIVTYAEMHFTRCTINGGLYPYSVGGSLTRVLIDSKAGQAFRPSINDYFGSRNKFPSMPWTITDTYLRIPAGRSPAHVEASQILGGSGYTFRNTVFDTGCPFNNTQTADLNLHASNSSIIDSWFIGCGGYAIYSDGPNVQFVNPRFANNHPFGKLYRNDDRNRVYPTIVNPMDLNGNPIQVAGAQAGSGGSPRTNPAQAAPTPAPPPPPPPPPPAPPAPAPTPPTTTVVPAPPTTEAPQEDDALVEQTTRSTVDRPDGGRAAGDRTSVAAAEAALLDEVALAAPPSSVDAGGLLSRPATLGLLLGVGLVAWSGWSWLASRRTVHAASGGWPTRGRRLGTGSRSVSVDDSGSSAMPGTWKYQTRSR